MPTFCAILAFLYFYMNNRFWGYFKALKRFDAFGFLLELSCRYFGLFGLETFWLLFKKIESSGHFDLKDDCKTIQEAL